jgi:hypothetical protein
MTTGFDKRRPTSRIHRQGCATAWDGVKAPFAAGSLAIIRGSGFWKVRSVVDDSVPGQSSASARLPP